MTQEFLDELAFAMQTARVLTQELKEAKSLFALGLEAQKFNITVRAISYFILSDPQARQDIMNTAKRLKDKDVFLFVKEFEEE